MADKPVVHIGENSPEQIAYNLFKHIVDVEDKRLSTSERYPEKVATRQYILETYAEALKAVQGSYYPKK
ncbi:hypothetical protein M8994_18350 [Brucella sp. 21LCYQ03]|nr:hypothetical protein [Brucella sp. 21LCYQ03]